VSGGFNDDIAFDNEASVTAQFEPADPDKLLWIHPETRLAIFNYLA